MAPREKTLHVEPRHAHQSKNTGLHSAVGNLSNLHKFMCLTVDPEVTSSISAWSHTFVEIDHEIISLAILLPSADSFKKGCCQLQAKVCARSTG